MVLGVGSERTQRAASRVDALFHRAPEPLLTLSVERVDGSSPRFRIEAAIEAAVVLAEQSAARLVGADPATALPFMRASGLLDLCTDVVVTGRELGRELLVVDGASRWFEIGVTSDAVT